jgi:hypothetical protein
MPKKKPLTWEEMFASAYNPDSEEGKRGMGKQSNAHGENRESNAELIFSDMEKIPKKTNVKTIDYINVKNNFVVEVTGTYSTDIKSKIEEAMAHTNEKEIDYLITERNLSERPRVYTFFNTYIPFKSEHINWDLIRDYVVAGGFLNYDIDGFVFRNSPGGVGTYRCGGEIIVYYKDRERINEKDFKISPEYVMVRL